MLNVLFYNAERIAMRIPNSIKFRIISLKRISTCGWIKTYTHVYIPSSFYCIKALT